ncbi:MAG: hypothetical protein WBQ10_21565 [Terriglobales bacterium]
MSKRGVAIKTILGLALWASFSQNLAAEEAPAANEVAAHLLVTVRISSRFQRTGREWGRCDGL